MIGVGCRVELLLQCKIFYFPAGDEVSSAVPCAPLTFPKPAMLPRSLLLHIDSISVLRLPSFYPASLSLLVPDSGRARAHVSDMSYAPLNDGSEAMLTREEQASIHHEPRLSKPSRARRSRSCRQIWLCVPSNADKTRPPIYAQAEAVDDMEGALHYQNVAAPTGPSQRAKSSTYPTNSMYARAQETMLKMREMAKDGMAKAAKTAKQGMASLERSINAPPAWSAAGVSSRPAGQRTAVGVNPPGFNGDSTVNGALDNDVDLERRRQDRARRRDVGRFAPGRRRAGAGLYRGHGRVDRHGHQAQAPVHGLRRRGCPRRLVLVPLADSVARVRLRGRRDGATTKDHARRPLNPGVAARSARATLR